MLETSITVYVLCKEQNIVYAKCYILVCICIIMCLFVGYSVTYKNDVSEMELDRLTKVEAAARCQTRLLMLRLITVLTDSASLLHYSRITGCN